MLNAYSYVRFSSQLQKLSDSKRRQISRTKKWCKEKKYNYCEAGEDLGVSGSTGKNLDDTKALGAFIKSVEENKIKTPCILVVESLDRLTRLEVDKAHDLCKKLIRLGVSIASVEDDEIFDEKSLTDIFPLLMLLVRLNTYNEYAKKLGDRSRLSWAQKRKGISPENILTKVIPSWLNYNKKTDRLEIVEERAKIVRKIYDDYLGGMGIDNIAKQLNIEKIPTPSQWQGKKYLSDSNKKSKAGTVWPPTTVKRFLTSPSVYGAHQPHRHIGSKKIREGEPIENYYPPIIDRAKYWEVQDALRKRAAHSGPRSESRNLFSGYVFCECCGYPMLYKRGSGKWEDGSAKKYQYLYCKRWLKAGNKECKPEKMFNYQDFEDALIGYNVTFLFDRIYAPETSESYAKLREKLKEKEELLITLQENIEEHARAGVPVQVAQTKVANELQDEVNVLRENLHSTDKNYSNPDYVWDALREIQEEEREPLENNAANRMTVSNLLRDKYQRIEINPHTGIVSAVTHWNTMDYVKKVEEGLELEVMAPTKYLKMKKRFVTEWFDMFTKEYDFCDRGGYQIGSVSASGAREYPKKSDWYWSEYRHELLWR